jgi:hypothetical protein
VLVTIFWYGVNGSGVEGMQAQLCLLPAFTLVSYSTCFSTLKMEAICSSETSVDTQRTTRRYIPEDGTSHNHCCENLKSFFGIVGMFVFG